MLAFILSMSMGAGAVGPHFAHADELATLATSGVGIALEGDPGADDFSVVLHGTGEAPLAKPEVFPIDGPPRLVIDIPKLTSKTSQSITVDHARVSSVRVGVHPNKTRIVLDLSADSVAPRFAVRKLPGGDGYGVAVTFSGALPAEDSHADSGGTDDGSGDVAPESAKKSPPEQAAKQTAKAVKEAGKPEKIEDDAIASLFEEELKKSAAARKAGTKAAPAPKAQDADVLDSAMGDGDPVSLSGGKAAAKTGEKSAKVAAPPPDEPSFDEDLGESSIPEEKTEEPAKVAKKGGVAEEAGVPEEAITETVDSGTPSDGKGNVVKGIFYQMTSGAKVPAVVFDVEGLSSYTLKKKKPDLFELTLDNVKLAGRHLTLPQFPPDAFFGFNVIVAKEEGKNVAVKIYIEEGVKLFPFIAKKQLWLKANK